MKGKKSFFTLLIACVVVVLLCLPGAVFAKGPNPPSLEADEKLIGPMLHGVLIAGWKFTGYINNLEVGTVEAFLQVEDKLYAEIISKEVPLDYAYEGFLQMTAADITNFALPAQIVLDYNMGDPGLGARAVIFEEKDVSNFAFTADERIEAGLTYTHILHCNVKVSFIIPKK